MDITVAILTIPQRFSLLGQAARSVFEQTFEDFELLLVDNGQEDNTAALRGGFDDSRVRVVRAGGSIAAARNAAAAAAAGEFVAFVDDDDTVSPDYIKLLLGAARENSADIAVAGAPQRVLPARDAVRALLLGEIGGELTGRLIRSELLRSVKIPEERVLDGTAAGWRLLAASERLVCVPGAEYFSGSLPDRVRAADDDPKLLTADYIVEHLAAHAEREEYISANMPELRELSRYADWAYMLEMVGHITELGLARCYAPLRYMRNELKNYWQDIMYGEFTRDIDRERMRRYVSN